MDCGFDQLAAAFAEGRTIGVQPTVIITHTVRAGRLLHGEPGRQHGNFPNQN